MGQLNYFLMNYIGKYVSNIDYIIGFPEDKLCFMNYNNTNSNYINNINKK